MPKAEQRVVFGLTAKLVVFACSIALTCAIALGAWLTKISRATLETAGRDYRLAVAEDIADSLRNETVGAQTALLTAADLLSAPGLDNDARLAIVISHVGAAEAIDHVRVYDADGDYIDTILDPTRTGFDGPEPLPESLRNLVATRAVAVGGTQFRDTARITLVAAIRTEDATTGYVSTAAPLSAVNRRLATLSEERLRAASARVTVVDRTARVLASSGEDVVGASLAKHPLLYGLDVRFQERIAMSSAVVVDGESRVSSLLPLPDFGWAVIVEVPAAVAYAAVDEMHQSIWIAVLAFLALAVVASVLGARRITGPLRRLAEFATAIGAREFDRRAEIESADEVGQLAGVLNHAAAELKAGDETIRRETKIRADLGRYLPHELVDAVVQQRQSLELGGVRAPMTVMFADVVRFTPLCERLEPEQTVALLNELFTIVTEIVFRHGGTVDKFIGDGIMCFWGAPEPCDDHADRALSAADDILRWLEVGNDGWRTQFGVELELAIGINTGVPIVGNIGSETRMEYTAIGEAVNIAARLEALARPNQVLTTAATREQSSAFDFAKVREEVLAVGGEPIEIYEVLL